MDGEASGPIVQPMDTLKTPFAPTATLPARYWRPAVAWFNALRGQLGRSDEDRFLAQAVNLEDLEDRLKQLERHGLPPR